MKKYLLFTIALIAVLALSANLSRVARAAGTVTDCSIFGPGAGTLQPSLSGGGTVLFECSGTIIVPEIWVSVDTRIDASEQIVILSGNNAERVLRVNTGVEIELRNITIANGKGPSSDVPYSFGGDGGGIFNNGNLILINTTISNNSAGDGTDGGGNGGGIANQFGTVTLINSTISGNSTGYRTGQLPILHSGRGGGIDNYGGEVILINSTISNNSAIAGNGGGIANFEGAGVVTLVNSIVADQLLGEDCEGDQFISNGHNMDSDGSCGLSVPGDLTADPKLSPLQYNGGPTETHALLPGSPAIDAGDDSACPETDQRGVTRPHGSACDIGAFEALEFQIQVTIDIKPGSFPNSINLKSNGKVPVAILSTDDFDAHDVDPNTCVFASAKPVQYQIVDVNKDEDADLLLKFKTQELDLINNSTEATLVCETHDGIQVVGTDSVNFVPKDKTGGNKIERLHRLISAAWRTICDRLETGKAQLNLKKR